MAKLLASKKCRGFICGLLFQVQAKKDTTGKSVIEEQRS